jgi:D,D-heptose 1,7-bisphosphate phosphatase
MANKAVFLDRDGTIIEDPGYLADPSGVRLLPGAETALKSLAQAGYRLVVTTNQSGIARGLLTEEALKQIHAELRRQLGEQGAHLDAIYYCPFHPEGTVEQYAVESDLRKPRPGMLLRAAEELEIDLSESWMVGDAPRDIEAGQRAGCRTIRVRTPQGRAVEQPDQDENVQADFTVRNLVDAARVVLRESGNRLPNGAAHATVPKQPPAHTNGESTAPPALDDSRVRQEILRHVRQMAAERQTQEFSFLRLLGAICQMLAAAGLAWTLLQALRGHATSAITWGIITMVLQMMALTFFTIPRGR